MALEIEAVEPATPDSGQDPSVEGAPTTPDSGQSVTAQEGTTAAPVADSTPGMYDPESWSGKQVHEHWQPMYTKRSQELAEMRKVADQWGQVQQNPWPVIQDFLQRSGYRAVPAAQAQEGGELEGGEPAVNQQAIEQQVAAMLDQKLAPLQANLQQRETNNVILELNREFPDWQQYETEITQNLKQYPNLAFDIQKLYDMSVPGTVRDARAYQRYLKQNDNRQQLAKSEPAASTVKPEAAVPTTSGDFEASWRYAMEKHGIKTTL